MLHRLPGQGFPLSKKKKKKEQNKERNNTINQFSRLTCIVVNRGQKDLGSPSECNVCKREQPPSKCTALTPSPLSPQTQPQPSERPNLLGLGGEDDTQTEKHQARVRRPSRDVLCCMLRAWGTSVLVGFGFVGWFFYESDGVIRENAGLDTRCYTNISHSPH